MKAHWILSLLLASSVASLATGCSAPTDPATEEGDQSALELSQLPANSPLRIAAEEINQEWLDGNIMNGDARLSVGKLRIDGVPKDSSLIKGGRDTFDAYIKLMEDPLAGDVASDKMTNQYTKASERIPGVALAVGVEGFVYSNNEGNLKPLRDQITQLVKMVGTDEKVDVIYTHSYVKLAGGPDDELGKTFHVQQSFFVNRETGEYVAFVSREGWI